MGNDAGLLELFIKDVSKYPLLSAKEEQDLSKKILRLKAKIKKLEKKNTKKKRKDAENELASLKLELERNKNTLINSNLRLVITIAGNYKYSGIPLLDLVSEGSIGLMTAADKFDYTKNCRFSTYSACWIKQAITKAIADSSRDIRLPVNVFNAVRKYNKVSQELTQKLGRTPYQDEIADSLGVTVSKVKEFARLSQNTSSLNIMVENEDSCVRLQDLIQDEACYDPFETVSNDSVKENVHALLTKLGERERKILQLRFGLTGQIPFSLDETGKFLNISRERVRQIQTRAINKLREFPEFAVAG